MFATYRWSIGVKDMKRSVALRRKAEKKARKAAKKAAREAENRKSAKRRAEKRDVKVKTVEDRLCWKLVGLALVAAAVFLALALATFDWESVRTLCENPRETRNLIGVLGNGVAHGAYVAFGLAAWCFPLAFLIGGLKLQEPIPKEVEEIPNRKVWLRVLGLVLMTLAITGLFQLAGRWGWVQQLLSILHVGDNAGGWIGYAFMTQGLEQAIAAFGATFISLGLLFASLCMALGLKTVLKLFDWRLPEVGGLVSDTADALTEGAGMIKERVSERMREDAPPPKVIRAEPKPMPKIKYPMNAELPPISLLNPVPAKAASGNDATAMGEELMKKLKEFNLYATLAYTVEGPTVTQFAIKPGHGVRVERITSLAKDLQLELGVKSLRVFAPIPGEKAIGVQVSNPNPQPVYFREVIESENWAKNATWTKSNQPKYPVPLLLGQDVAGRAIVADLAKMPHLLVAGASGKGKSVCLNSMIGGLLMSRTPEQLRFIFVDPKFVEFSCYANLPHLLIPVVTDVKKVLGALRWAAKEMERRLKLFSEVTARNILDYNAKSKEKVPYIVIVIDEVADIMAQCGRDVEPVLGRLMALARATGIHLILATQRPDVKTISGTIKANIPGRIALGTTNVADSRTILDEGGAELLVGKGDMLYKTDEGLIRTQGALILNEEIDRIVQFAVKQWPAQIDASIEEEVESESEGGGGDAGGDAENGISEEEYNQAKAIVIEANRASVSLLQQRMRIGYNHASRMIDLLEKRGVIGPHRGAGPREVLVG